MQTRLPDFVTMVKFNIQRQRGSAASSKGHLKHKGISKRTQDRYERQLRAFFLHLHVFQIALPTSQHDLDQEIAEFINDMYQNGEPHGYAGDFISAISRAIPRARAHIPTARLWFRNWGRELQRSRALPMPAHVVTGFAGLALAMRRMDLAALLPTAFTCFLRTSEIYGLQRQHITFKPDLSKAIITLPQTKTSGPNSEEVVVHDRAIVQALFEVCKSQRLEDYFYSRPARFFGEDLRWLASLTGFRHQRLQPYSLRRGGATWHMHKYGSLSLTALRGRWKHERTAKIYIDGAAAEWAAWHLTGEATQLLARSTRLFKEYFISDVNPCTLSV